MSKFDCDLVLFTTAPNDYAPLRIGEECKNRGLRYRIIKYAEINLSFDESNFDLNYLGQKMPNAKSIFLRGLGEDSTYNVLKTAIIDWYKKRGAKVLNHNSFSKWPSLDKGMQYVNLSSSGLSVVQSFSFGSKKSLLEWARGNYPFIAKQVVGSCGYGVFKIENDADLRDKLELRGFLKTIQIKTMLFQKFLKSGEDLRIIVMGGKVMGAMKRIAQSGQYLTNYSQGGQVEKYDIDKDEDAKDIALKVAKLFKLDYCGVDLMRDNTGNWVVLEVNRACQFKGFEKSTGINVAGKIVDYLTK